MYLYCSTSITAIDVYGTEFTSELDVLTKLAAVGELEFALHTEATTVVFYSVYY